MRIEEGQNVFDICLQEFGDLELLIDEILIPNGLNINSDLSGGQEININTFGKGDEELKDFIRLNKLTFNNRSIEGETVIQPQIAIQWAIYVDLTEAIYLNKIIQV